MRLQAIIPARGGSRGVPNKNLQTIQHHTLVRIAAEKCRVVTDDVLVSTDHPEIMAEARSGGAEVHVRPDHLAGDEVSTEDVLCDCLDLQADVILLVQCTAPLMTVPDMRACVVAVQEGADVAVAAHKFHGFVLEGATGRILNHDRHPMRRQDMPQQWIPAGSCWAFRPEQPRYGLYHGRVAFIKAECPVACEIDSLEDLETARMLCKLWPN